MEGLDLTLSTDEEDNLLKITPEQKKLESKFIKLFGSATPGHYSNTKTKKVNKPSEKRRKLNNNKIESQKENLYDIHELEKMDQYRMKKNFKLNKSLAAETNGWRKGQLTLIKENIPLEVRQTNRETLLTPKKTKKIVTINLEPLVNISPIPSTPDILVNVPPTMIERGTQCDLPPTIPATNRRNTQIARLTEKEMEEIQNIRVSNLVLNRHDSFTQTPNWSRKNKRRSWMKNIFRNSNN